MPPDPHFSRHAHLLLDRLTPVRPNDTTEPQFYAHDEPRQLIINDMRRAGRSHARRLLELACISAAFTECTIPELLDKIVADNADNVDSAGEAKARFFLAAISSRSTHDLRPDFWRRFLGHIASGQITDRLFSEGNSTARTAVLGPELGRDTRTYHRLFWPLRLKEGEIIKKGDKVMPYVDEASVRDKKTWTKVTLSDNAVLTPQSHPRPTGPVFVKILRPSQRNAGAPNEWLVRDELAKHPRQDQNIGVPFAGVEDEEGFIHLFSDWGGQTLTQFLANHEPSHVNFGPDRFLKPFFQDLAGAISYGHHSLSSAELVHGDLKLDNILFRAIHQSASARPLKYSFLVVDYGNAKLSDHGVVKINPTTYNLGTYTAPEMHGDPTVTTASDVWSLGHIFAKVYIWQAREGKSLKALDETMGDRPFWTEHKNERVVHPDVIASMQQAKKAMMANQHQRRVFEELHDLIMHGMLVIDPRKRKTMKEIYKRIKKILESDTTPRPSEPHPTTTDSANLTGVRYHCPLISAESGMKGFRNLLIASWTHRLLHVILLLGIMAGFLLPSLTSRLLCAWVVAVCFVLLVLRNYVH